MKAGLRRELLGYAIALAFLLIVAYLVGLATSSLAGLGIDWYWWLGVALFLLPLVFWVGQKKEPSHRRQPVARAEELDLAQARYDYLSRRDSYLEDRMLRRVA